MWSERLAARGRSLLRATQQAGEAVVKTKDHQMNPIYDVEEKPSGIRKRLFDQPVLLVGGSCVELWRGDRPEGF